MGLKEREAVTGEIGLELNPAEATMPGAIPRKQLQTIIAQTEVPPESRRAFLGKIAVALVAALGLNLTGCFSYPYPSVVRPYPEGYPADIPPPEPEVPVGPSCPVYFDYDQCLPRPDQWSKLEQIFRYLMDTPPIQVTIIGHCDERGGTRYNFALGRRRAEAVRNYLIENGVAACRITAISRGREEPADPRHNPAAWARNRRVEFLYRAEGPQ